MNVYFWFLAGMLAGFAAALVVLPLMRGALASLTHRNVRIGVAVAGVAGFGAIAVILYRTFGSPELLAARGVTRTSPHAAAGMSASGSPAESMEAAVAKLEARIAREGGKREDWLLLAQSYDFLGRAADAERARANAEGRNGGAATQVAAAADAAQSGSPAAPLQAKTAESTAEYERRVRAQPADADAWRALAAAYRRQQDYAKARDAFAKLVHLKSMTADTWADYADVLASLSGGSLKGEAARAIDRALALDAAHPKALWLEASLAHEEHRYADALVMWMKLRAALPPDSSDVKIVDANIEEARQLAGLPATATAANAATAAPTVVAQVSGTVSVDRKLAARIPAGATLFIYAKAADSPGPPLAVLRQPAGAWPVAFRLDDSLAMIPTRRLSQFDKVIVEARISRSGQATPSPGDLYVTSAVLKPGNGKRLQLIIDHEVS